MALTRKLLESLGLESDKVSTIIDAHAETVDALKAQIENYKTDASKVAEVQKELEATQKELEGLKTTGGDWKTKYEKEHADFELFKAEQTKREERTEKENAYKALLKEAGVSEKRIDSIVKVTDLESITIENGKVKDADKLTESIKKEWGDFLTTQQTSGARTQTPPASTGGKMTKEEILKIKDSAQRQKAISENMELFGY